MKIYEKHPAGGIAEISNWTQSASPDHARVIRQLPKHEEDVVEKLQGQGRSDQSIWRYLHRRPQQAQPKNLVSTVPLLVDDLNQQQLINLLERYFVCSLPSLQHMSIDELRIMLKKLLSSGLIEVQLHA